MSTIAARFFKRTRRVYRCDECNRIIQGRHIYGYGHADDGCPPFGVRLHIDCARKWCEKDAKFAAAVAQADAEAAHA